MSLKDDAEKLLIELREKIDELIEKGKDASGEVREELDETIEKLKVQRDKLEVKIDAFREKNEPKIEEAKFHLKNAMEEIGKAFEKIFKKGPRAEEM
ncbi:MAG: hypothetical protein COW03_08630 [Cytophagales bacterium CG12_big_fil_rev_8_21_14_0_65_40_12]|uniref:hypothetical protein n=1 Tax=Roseivirga sp. TaxID=1964215 RepID=UPI000C471C08|nr:MAG: hypothetical protein COW03_08630 [Cytophagales bacterium CG12_big_fil_rev_8_21_14_0_65_40_12]PIW05481.1 MAG: hypothetical protein COW40_04320 [Cytophagales bacterium CG17_big_fil_post_rev_8_21_14_2_50_40_13]